MKIRDVAPTMAHFVTLSTVFQSGIVGGDVDVVSANVTTFTNEDVDVQNILDGFINDGMINVNSSSGRYVFDQNWKEKLTSEAMF